MTRSVWRKRFKIAGLVLSIMMLGLWVFSVKFILLYVPVSRQWTIFLSSGQIVYDASPLRETGWTCHVNLSDLAGFAMAIPVTTFAHVYLGFDLPGTNGDDAHIPLWLPVFAVGFPTAILWWRDRRPKAGFCKACEYDLTGNVSGTCPECGTTVE